MNAKHTPGPWIAAIEPGISTVGNKCKVFSAKSAFFAIIDGGEYSEGCANARLIAAAPELLEAIKLAQVDLATCSMIFQAMNKKKETVSPMAEELRGKIRTLEALVAKAEGRDE